MKGGEVAAGLEILDGVRRGIKRIEDPVILIYNGIG
jgi:hypothetical protein